MFGIIIFGLTPFTSISLLGEQQWVETCPSDSEWNNINSTVNNWDNEINTASNWDVRPPNVLPIKGCR